MLVIWLHDAIPTCPSSFRKNPNCVVILRSVLGLEDSIEILNAQYAACEIVKLDTADLRDSTTAEVDKQGFLDL